MSDVTVAERLGWLRRTARRWILALVLLLVAVLVGTTWTLGAFSASSANPHNMVSSGTMSQDSTADNTAFMKAADMVPGSRVEGSVTIGNAGDASGDFRLTVEDLEDVPGPGGGELSGRLQLTVSDTRLRRPVYVGPLEGLDVSLGTWAPDEERTYDFEVRLPDDVAQVDNAFQASSVTATFVWSAIQSQ